MKRVIYSIILAGILVTVIYWQMFSAPDSDTKTSILFTINSGENIEKIAERLESKGIIRSDKMFRFIALIRGLDTKIAHGRFPLSQNMNLQEVLNAISSSERKEVKITIPEGFTVREIDERLFRLGLILRGEFHAVAQNLEGYLFPDTYFVFSPNFDTQSLVKKMQDNFLAKLTPDFFEGIKKENRGVQDIIKVASILEKEVKTTEDYPIVAGILWKRLKAGWPLQTDATLLYGKSTSVITQNELTEDSLYNTYQYKGLPPTPISNPGLFTIKAAIFPKESPYWFYLTDKEGNVHYARSNEEQNENRRKYLRE